MGRGPDPPGQAPRFPEDVVMIARRVQPYTMTSIDRIAALVDAVDYVVRAGIGGALAECGVWRGGSVLAMIAALQRHGVADRDLYLYDTFSGMTRPTEHDRTEYGPAAVDTWETDTRAGRHPWGALFGRDKFSLAAVRETLGASGYPVDRMHFVQGPVEATLPAQAPGPLALLRLDTDWYESTLHELVHLYPLLARGGVLIIDDYGHWEGCRRAVDEYFARADVRPVLLARIDYTGRIAVKP
jgi:O-methyltransferase